MNTSLCLHIPRQPHQLGSWQGCWGTLDGCFPWGLSACWLLQFLWHCTPGVYLLTVAEHGLTGHTVQYKNATRAILEVLWTLRYLLPGHAKPGCALGSLYQCIPGIQLRLQWGANQMHSGMTYIQQAQRERYTATWGGPVPLGQLSTVEKQWYASTFPLPWRLCHHHAPCRPWPQDPVALMTDGRVYRVWQLARGWPLPWLLSFCSLPCSYLPGWTADRMPGNTPVHSRCETSLMRVVL